MKTATKTEQLKSALREKGVRFFEYHGDDQKYNAQRNLSERTHYVDDGTLRYFKSRILFARPACDGLLFMIIESVSSRPENGGKTKRAVIFDVFGTVVSRSILDGDSGWFRTSGQAMNYGLEFIRSFDPMAHTESELRRIIAKETEANNKALELLES